MKRTTQAISNNNNNKSSSNNYNNGNLKTQSKSKKEKKRLKAHRQNITRDSRQLLPTAQSQQQIA